MKEYDVHIHPAGFVLATNVSAGKINTRALGGQEEGGSQPHNDIDFKKGHPYLFLY